MKNTVPVNATGLPNRRTAMLASLAGLGAAVSLPKATHAATTADPAVADLAAIYDAAHRRYVQADALQSEAQKRTVRVPVPASLIEREDDPLTRVFAPTDWIDGTRWFGTDERIALLRKWDTSTMTADWWAPVLARRGEVLADHDAWEAAQQVAKDAAGETAACAECRAAWAAEKAIRFRILDLRSSTPAVQHLKLRIFVDSISHVDWREGLEDLVDQGVEIEGGPWEDAFAFSIIRDLATSYMGG